LKLNCDVMLSTSAFDFNLRRFSLELYAAQEEAVMELVSGASVVLTTPTGSGKTLVATAAIAAATARGDVGRTLNIPQRTAAPHSPLISAHICIVTRTHTDVLSAPRY